MHKSLNYRYLSLNLHPQAQHYQTITEHLEIHPMILIDELKKHKKLCEWFAIHRPQIQNKI